MTRVYVLSDPRDGKVRYVGRSVNPKARLRAHCGRYIWSRNKRKCAWIKRLRNRGLRPVLTEYRPVSFPEAAKLEADLIQRHSETTYNIGWVSTAVQFSRGRYR